MAGKSGRRNDSKGKKAAPLSPSEPAPQSSPSPPKSPEPDADEGYRQWKSLIPVLYDWITNHNLEWPSLACRWGQQLERGKFKNLQRLYFSERTDGNYPHTLIVAECEIVNPRTAPAEYISQFDEESSSPFVKTTKTIIHHGEVHRIKEFPQNSRIVATHTESPDVLIWDVDIQPDHNNQHDTAICHPDLRLVGHEKNAEYALAMCSSEPLVLSGGMDKLVVLWSIHDHVSALAEAPSTTSPDQAHGSRSGQATSESPTVKPRTVFQGHKNTVEDVQFCPSSPQEFCSVGDDSYLILWDARVGTRPVLQAKKAHAEDIHCVDWNPHDVNLLLTGSADTSVHMFDRRKLTSKGVALPVHEFQDHKAAVLCVQWSPDKSSVFGSAGEDNFLILWDSELVGKGCTPSREPQGLFFKHAGHRNKVVDFHWNGSEPWTIASLSDDCGSEEGGGTLQVWRIMDMLYRPEKAVLDEMGAFSPAAP